MVTNHAIRETRSKEIPAERWARWKTKRALDPTPSRPHKVSDQRRRAQRLSVTARRRNAALLRQGEQQRVRQARERERQREASLDAFLSGRCRPSRVAAVLTDEDRENRRLYLERRWEIFKSSQTLPLLYLAPSLYVNSDAAAFVELALGKAPIWLRATSGYREHPWLTFHPPRSWWNSDERLILAIRVIGYEYDDGNPKPYQHRVEVYWLRPTDLLEHDERGAHDLPAEAVPWASVLAATSIIRIVGLPVPSMRQATRAIKRYWHEGGPRQVPMPA
jgi:hypothetical protein